MGFFDAILHAVAISTIEARREVRQEEQKARNRSDKCMSAQDSLNDLLKRTGSPALYISNFQKAEAEISKMNRWTKKYEEYLDLGGHAKSIKRIENIDDELQFIKGLSAIGKVFEQDKFRQERDYWRKLMDPTWDYDLAADFSEKAAVSLIIKKGFGEREALWILSQCNIDWTLQAKRAAHNYLDACHHQQSKERLIEQLIFDEFTEEQARQAADYWWNT